MRVNTRYGSGRITEIRSNNNIIVELDNRGLRIRQTYAEIVPQDTEALPKAAEPRDERRSDTRVTIPFTLKRKVETSQYLNLKALEALRFGLVPQTKLEEMTIKFDDLQSWINECLPHINQGNPCVSEVCGPYGTGKSHIMSIVRYIAQRENYVTARVEIDGKGISLGDPENLLLNLWSSLRAEGLQSATPLLDLYVRAINNGKAAPKIAPKGVDRIAVNYEIIKDLKQNGRLETFEYMLDAILSSSNEYTATEVNQKVQSSLSNRYQFVRRMIGRTVEERPYDFIESLVGHAKICELAGYRGLILTIDEFEVQHFDTYRDRVIKLSEVMTNYFANKTSYPAVPCAVFFATVGELGHRGDALVDAMIEICGGNYRKLEELEESDLIEIAKKIHYLYKKTYGISDNFNTIFAESAYKAVMNVKGLVRAFIKQYVSMLDEKYGPPKI